MAASDALHPKQREMAGQGQLFQPEETPPKSYADTQHPLLEEHRQFSESAPMQIRVDDSNVGNILKEGFKTQHETGWSNGTYDPEYRAQFEDDTWGGGARPSYGYFSHGDLRDAGFGNSINEHGEEIDPYAEDVTAYGSTALELKPGMRKDTTYSAGDSLGNDTSLIGKAGKPLAAFYGGYGSDGYTEMQVHKPIGAGDIKKANIFQRSDEGNDAYREQIAASRDTARSHLRAAGIPNEVREIRRYEQPTLPVESWGDADLVDAHDPVTHDKLPLATGASEWALKEAGAPRREKPEAKGWWQSDTTARWSPEMGEYPVGKGGVVSPTQFKPRDEDD